MLPAFQTEDHPKRAQEDLRGRTVPTAKNRGRLDVVADVLSACSKPAGKNAVLIRANINSVTATYILAKLMDSRLMDTVVDEEGRVAYIATKQGAAFVSAYRNLSMMLTSELVPETRAARSDIELFA